jgi:hypothetical protein
MDILTRSFNKSVRTTELSALLVIFMSVKVFLESIYNILKSIQIDKERTLTNDLFS